MTPLKPSASVSDLACNGRRKHNHLRAVIPISLGLTQTRTLSRNDIFGETVLKKSRNFPGARLKALAPRNSRRTMRTAIG
jgi:hypothetical protein